MSGAQAIVDAGVNAFGDVHGVVNNAGVVRDRMFASMTEDEWDLVIKVHLKGHFCIASRLVQRWRDQTKRSEEHTSELQSLMRISYAVFCLKKKKKTQSTNIPTTTQHSTINHIPITIY